MVAVRGTDINSFFKARFYLRGLGLRILKNAAKVFFLAPAHKKELFDNYIPSGLKEETEAKSYIITSNTKPFYKELGGKFMGSYLMIKKIEIEV